jgi:hypothetical protein
VDPPRPRALAAPADVDAWRGRFADVEWTNIADPDGTLGAAWIGRRREVGNADEAAALYVVKDGKVCGADHAELAELRDEGTLNVVSALEAIHER